MREGGSGGGPGRGPHRRRRRRCPLPGGRTTPRARAPLPSRGGAGGGVGGGRAHVADPIVLMKNHPHPPPYHQGTPPPPLPPRAVIDPPPDNRAFWDWCCPEMYLGSALVGCGVNHTSLPNVKATHPDPKQTDPGPVWPHRLWPLGGYLHHCEEKGNSWPTPHAGSRERVL